MENGIDLDEDGKVSKQEQSLYEQRARNRRAMAWVALVTLIVSGFALMFFVPETRLTHMDGLLELYWISLGSIVGAYVGISTWMSRKDKD